MRSTTTATRSGVQPPVDVAPGARPLLGHAASLVRSPLDFLATMGTLGSDLVEVRLGPQRAVLVCDPELTRQVLVNARIFDKGGRVFDKIRRGAGDGLVSSAWPVHRRHRPLLQPAFHPRTLPGFSDVMWEETAASVATWQDGMTVDFSATMQRYALRVLLRTLFSSGSIEPFMDEVQRWVPVVLEGAYSRAMNPIDALERLPLPGNRRYMQGQRTLRDIASKIIAEYQDSAIVREDLLTMMLAARDETTGRGLTAAEINDHVYTLLFAGTETTASLVSWAFWLLSRYPEAAGRLHEELDALPSGVPIGLDVLRGLDYTRRVLLETLRLYPATWLLTRTTTEDYKLGEHLLPTGTTVMFSPYLIHRRADIFPQPDRFDPDRWLPERMASLPRGAFVPFGGGSRKCIGEEFGLTEGTIALVGIAKDWSLAPVDDRPQRPVPRIALSPGPMPMVVRSRRAG